MKRVADLLVDTLVTAGVERIYGLAGDSLNASQIQSAPGIILSGFRGEQLGRRTKLDYGLVGDTRARRERQFLPATSELRLSGRRAI